MAEALYMALTTDERRNSQLQTEQRHYHGRRRLCYETLGGRGQRSGGGAITPRYRKSEDSPSKRQDKGRELERCHPETMFVKKSASRIHVDDRTGRRTYLHNKASPW